MNEVFLIGAERYLQVGGWGLFVAQCLLLVHLFFRGKILSQAAHERELGQVKTSSQEAVTALKETHVAAIEAMRANSDREILSLREGLTAALAANNELFSQQAKLVSGFSVVHKAMEVIASPRDEQHG